MIPEDWGSGQRLLGRNGAGTGPQTRAEPKSWTVGARPSEASCLLGKGQCDEQSVTHKHCIQVVGKWTIFLVVLQDRAYSFPEHSQLLQDLTFAAHFAWTQSLQMSVWLSVPSGLCSVRTFLSPFPVTLYKTTTSSGTHHLLTEFSLLCTVSPEPECLRLYTHVYISTEM